MGEQGRHLAGRSRARVARVLTRAHADEWCAHYNFRFAALVLRGFRAPDTERFLREAVAAEEALERISGERAPGLTGR